MGNPRNKNSNPKPHEFHQLNCTSVQKIEFRDDAKKSIFPLSIYIDGQLLTHDEVEQLAINDGFESPDELFAWFDNDFKGKLVHWTKHRY